MRSVKISELKKNLDEFLDEVRQGEELVIRDRNRPIAKIIPLFPAEDEDAEEARLEAAGILRRREKPLPDSFFSMPGPNVPLEKAVAAVMAERDED
jgi:prevent-host-death family protein